jgi:glycosyltransferase involved in cell wall biosynthesis
VSHVYTRYEKYAHYVPLPARLVRSLAVRLACRFADSADLIVAPSDTWPRLAAPWRLRAVVIPPGGSQSSPGQPGAGAAASAAGDGLICLYTGRPTGEEPERVLDARVGAAAVSTATLHLVGKGSHGQALQRRAAAGRARHRIVFHGGLAREALPDYYRAADLFLFASETETQGLVLAEAHACALPAVAVRASGVDEVVIDGETGLLTKAETGEMADAAIGLLLDAERRARLGQAARRLVEARFAAPKQTATMVARYEALRARRA